MGDSKDVKQGEKSSPDVKPEQKKPPASRVSLDRRQDIERLAATIFASKICGAASQTKSSVFLAADALAAAKDFYRMLDEQDTLAG